MNSSKQSIMDILKSREERVIHQKKLLKQYGHTLISYKINIPGEIKDSPLYRKIFKTGWGELLKTLEEKPIEIVFKNEIYKASGPEAYIILREEAKRVKKLTTCIEEQHPLGRIFDFDILYGEGNQISRTQIGKKPRKCFICHKNAFECGRSRNHSLEELLTAISNRAQFYFENKNGGK